MANTQVPYNTTSQNPATEGGIRTLIQLIQQLVSSGIIIDGGNITIGNVGVKNIAGSSINPAQEDGGNLAAVVTNTSGLAKESGGNLAAVVTNTSGLAKESGGNLAAVVTNTSGLATVVTNTTGLAKESGGNLATVVTNTSGLAKESGGNLAALALAQSVPVSQVPVNVLVGNTADTNSGSTLNTVQITAFSTPCKFVLLYPPDVASLNTVPVYEVVNVIQPNQATILLGRSIEISNFEGIKVYTDNANKVWLGSTVAEQNIRYVVVV